MAGGDKNVTIVIAYMAWALLPLIFRVEWVVGSLRIVRFHTSEPLLLGGLSSICPAIAGPQCSCPF
jgi:hypothetical protein